MFSSSYWERTAPTPTAKLLASPFYDKLFRIVGMEENGRNGQMLFKNGKGSFTLGSCQIEWFGLKITRSAQRLNYNLKKVIK